MKTICSAIALTIAFPAFAAAQTSPAAPTAPEHAGHDQPMEHKDMGKMDCCEKHAKDKAADDAHMGHEGMQH